MTDRLRVLVVGDGPNLPSGLGRIARELCAHLHMDAEALGVDLVQLGKGPHGGWPWPTQSWPDGEEQELHTPRSVCVGRKPDVVFTVLDPGRLLHVYRWAEAAETPCWGYFPIDAAGGGGVFGRGFGGPAAHVVRTASRVLAYTEFGRKILQDTLRTPGRDEPLTSPDQVEVLPHGLAQHWKLPGVRPAGEPLVVGAVGTNQPRKDWGWFFQGMSILREGLKDRALRVRVKTDVMVKTWSIYELLERWGLEDCTEVIVDEDEHGQLRASPGGTAWAMQDHQLREWYASCHLTVAVGLGEGWGYPIMESLACGRPVVGVAYAGGEHMTPALGRILCGTYRAEGVYGLLRPVLDPYRLVASVLNLRAWQEDVGWDASEALCAGAADHLGWARVWPAWREWWRRGLDQIRQQEASAKG